MWGEERVELHCLETQEEIARVLGSRRGDMRSRMSSH